MRLAWAADVAAVAALQLRALRDRLPTGLAADIDLADVELAWRTAVTRPPTARHRVVVATEDSVAVATEDSVAVATEDSVAVATEDSVAVATEDSVAVATEDSGLPPVAGAGRPGPPVVAPADLGTTGSGHVVGFVATGPAEDPDADPAIDGEVLALHAAVPDAELLAALLAAGADTLEADGFTRAQVWIAADDDPLRRVADAAGWAPDGAHRRLSVEQSRPEDPELAQVRLHTGLGPPPPPA